MNSEKISTIALEPFISKFVLTIIKSIRDKNLSYEKRYVIHSDLVPKVSEKVMQTSLGEKVININKTAMTLPRRKMDKLVTPRMPSKIIHPILFKKVPVGLDQKYGKITSLLNDPSVSTIEYQGAGKPITVIRAGERQITNINLSVGEIKEILKKISDATHIPILEGVFRAAVDNFSINAVVSEMIGSRFIIRKQTAYSILER